MNVIAVFLQSQPTPPLAWPKHSLSALSFDTENLRYSLKLPEQVPRTYKQLENVSMA